MHQPRVKFQNNLRQLTIIPVMVIAPTLLLLPRDLSKEVSNRSIKIIDTSYPLATLTGINHCVQIFQSIKEKTLRNKFYALRAKCEVNPIIIARG